MAARAKPTGTRMITILRATTSDIARQTHRPQPDDIEEIVIELPAGARVTFGPDVPSHPKVPRPDETRVYALRIYRDRTNASLCACFPRVIEWHDLDIKMLGKDGVTSL